MKAFNLNILMKSCCVEIDDEVYDELFDFLLEMDVDLNTLNIDDIYVNGVSFLQLDEREYTEEAYILKETEDGFWVVI